MKVRSEGANLEVADVEPCRCCQARTAGISTRGAGEAALEPQTHRLRPEGLSLNATFGGTVNNARNGTRSSVEERGARIIHGHCVDQGVSPK
jgi:hypothetical protein